LDHPVFKLTIKATRGISADGCQWVMIRYYYASSSSSSSSHKVAILLINENSAALDNRSLIALYFCFENCCINLQSVQKKNNILQLSTYISNMVASFETYKFNYFSRSSSG